MRAPEPSIDDRIRTTTCAGPGPHPMVMLKQSYQNQWNLFIEKLEAHEEAGRKASAQGERMEPERRKEDRLDAAQDSSQGSE